MKIIVIGSLPKMLLNFRGDLLRSLVKRGHKVTAMAEWAEPAIVNPLANMGVGFRSFAIKRNGLNPLVDLKTWYQLRAIFKDVKPDIILAYTIKPIVWGGIASRIVPQSRFYALVTGVGFAFQGKGLIRKSLGFFASSLYRISLSRAEKVIFQNSDNLQNFVSRGIVPESKCELVNGSGVNMERFVDAPMPERPITFLTIGRLLGEKGFREYARAAKIVKKKYPNVIFQLLGSYDPSPDRISPEEVEGWHDQGWLEYLGETSDVFPYLQACHIYVLPSYHEGISRTLLEAMSIGRPILTTDVPGCRETVVEGSNGYLVPKSDVSALVERMIWFIENDDQWEQMRRYSREIVEDKFDVHKVNAEMIKIMNA